MTYPAHFLRSHSLDTRFLMRKKSSHHKNKPFRLLVVAALSLWDMFTSYLAWTRRWDCVSLQHGKLRQNRFGKKSAAMDSTA